MKPLHVAWLLIATHLAVSSMALASSSTTRQVLIDRNKTVKL